MKTSLAKLARRICAEHQAALADTGSALEHAHQAGLYLLEAKGVCAHGAWLVWLESQVVGVGERQAENYMRIAKGWDEIAANPQHASETSIRAGLAVLCSGNGHAGAEPSSGATPDLATLTRDILDRLPPGEREPALQGESARLAASATADRRQGQADGRAALLGAMTGHVAALRKLAGRYDGPGDADVPAALLDDMDEWIRGA